MKMPNKAGVLIGMYELVFDDATPFSNCNSFKECGFRYFGKCMKSDPISPYLEDRGYVPDMFIPSDLSSAVLTTFDSLNKKDKEGLIWLDGIADIVNILPR
jgi:hypothetical protein